jgi:hypothetical protein
MDQPSPAGAAILSEPTSLLWDEPESVDTGKVLISQGKSRYINSKLWRNLGGHEMEDLSDQEDDTEKDNDSGSLDRASPRPPWDVLSDPLTGAFLGGPQLRLLQYHPSCLEAISLWETHIANVEPLCKMLHVPSTKSIVERISEEPGSASRSDECLLFAIYHFAVFSTTEEECVIKFGRSRHALRSQYHFALRQALVNASFLKSTDFAVLQALVLLLLSSRDHYDPHTYWILTGVAVRIGQRIGVHRDGQKLGLPPFEVEMRRRLFYQLMPLEAWASQMAGMGASILPDAWDTQPPLNINDEQIGPGMTEPPQEQTGATDMIFCLSRACVGKVIAKGAGSKPWTFKDSGAAEQVVNRAESAVEEKYIRYCDVVNPLHFLTACMARSGITAMRLRIRLPKAMGHSSTDAEAREALQLALKILDTDTTVCAHSGLSKYRWHFGSFSIWGTWDSCIVVLTTLARRSCLFSAAEADAAWGTVEALYSHHNELLEPKRALYVALGRLTLKAWEATPPSTADSSILEPGFIASLRAIRNPKSREKSKKVSDDTSQRDNIASVLSTSLTPETDWDPAFSSGSGGFGTDMDNGLDLDETDWTFWDRLIQDHGSEIPKEQGGFTFSQE